MDRTLIILHRVARWFVLAAVVVSPWLFASAEPWSCALISLLVLMGAAVWLFSMVCYPAQEVRIPAITTVLAILFAVIALQTWPLPKGLVGSISPTSAEVAAASVEMVLKPGSLPETDNILIAPEGKATFSVAPSVTRRSLFVFAGCLAAFLIMVNCTTSWHELRQEARVLVVCGFVMAVVSLVHKFSGSREILWFHASRYGGNFFGPFSNRNHFATHMVMILGLAVGLFLASTSFQEIYARESWRGRAAWFSTKKASQIGLLVFAVAIIGATVFITLSRGAIMSLMVALTAVSMFASFRFSERTGRKRILALVLLGLCIVTWLGWRPVVDRMATLAEIPVELESGTRMAATLDTLQILGGFPLLGSGIGTFRFVFPMFAREELFFGRFTHAHNDWAELLSEGGVVVGFLVLLCLFFFVKQIVKRFPIMRVHPRRFVLGCLIALIGAGVHSFFDYSMHRPANLLLVIVIAGMTIAALHLEVLIDPEDDQSVKNAELKASTSQLGFLSGRFSMLRISACVLLIGVIVLMQFGLECFRGGLAFKRFEQAERYIGRIKDVPGLVRVAKAGQYEVGGILGEGDPDEMRESAAVFFRWAVDKRLPVETRADLASDCMRTATHAVLATPSDYLAWVWLARAQTLAGRWEDADQSLERSRQLRPMGPAILLFPKR